MIEKKVIVITGASSGIGKALVYEYQKRGFCIVLAARNIEKLNLIIADINQKGTEAIAVQADVSIPQDCEKIIQAAIERFGKINILINNAGISMRALFSEVDMQVLHRLMETNFWGTVYCTKYALPHLLESKGSVIAVSSIAGFQGLPGRTAYSASKFAIHGFLEALRIENMHTGLHVLIACPGFTSSNIRKTALDKSGHEQGESPRDEKKMMPAEKVALKIANAIDRKKRTLILTTVGKLAVLLNKLLPAWFDKKTFQSMMNEPNSPLK